MRRNISIKTRLRLLKTYVYSILTYGCEAWTLNSVINKKITSFENWCYRRILKVKWYDKINNETILRMIGKPKFELLDIVKDRKLRYAGHILRGSSGTLLFNIIDGVIPGRRKRGRPRRLWEEDILEWLRLGTHEELKHLAADRDSYRAAVTSVLATNVHVVAHQ
ncbi:hypothetical protein M8J77_015813 [Diaphorina citri]|nr:hypothetical protein M8J77_015813 [Diaphorina citri]